jgi:hypothetical protein
VRFEALERSLLASDAFREVQDSPHRPAVAWGDGEPRPIDAFEELWIAAAEVELVGLESVLRELRSLATEDLVWHGSAVELRILREIVGVLCARAWRAARAGDHATAARAFADALRLAEATDARSQLGTMIRYVVQANALCSARGALALGLSPRELRAALAPLLAGWNYDPARGELTIRAEVAGFLADTGERAPDDPAEALRLFAGVDEALALARKPLARSGFGQEAPHAPDPGLDAWLHGVRRLHALQAVGNVAQTALAVAAHHESHGAWPSTLAEVTDLRRELALDPLQGTPLRYELTDGGVRIGPAAWAERVEPMRDLAASPFVWTLRQP